MAENTDEEHLDSTSIPLSENLSGQDSPVIDTDTITTNPEIENMDVHKHPHHITHKKKWGEYVLEFLMLFLAVYLGFLAENLREHRVEIEREEQFMKSMVQDIKKDITQADNLQLVNLPSKQLCDSLLVKFSSKEFITNSYPAYALWDSIRGFTDFVPNDGTIQQLKNSGALRLVRKQEVVEKIMDYYKTIELLRIHQSVMNTYSLQQTNKADLFDIIRFTNKDQRVNVSLLSSDKKLIGWAYLHISDWKDFLRILNRNVETTKSKGKEVLQLINKEYHMQNE